MINSQIIKNLILYFARFIPQETRQEIFKQSESSRTSFYKELMADINGIPEGQVIKELDTFILSINEKQVSDRVKKSKEHLLFVEYGNIDLQKPSTIYYNDIQLSISVASPFNESNNDMLGETLHMTRNLEILNIILSDLRKENEICGLVEYRDYSVKLTPLDPSLFFGHGGWAASIVRRDMVV